MTSQEILRKIEHADSVLSTTLHGKKERPKIFIFDIETAPMVSYHFDRWKTSIQPEKTINDTFMLCWSGMWVGDDKVFSECITPEEIKKCRDHRIVSKLWDQFNKADYVVAYNGRHFDIPYTNARFLVNYMNPPAPYIIVDPIETLKKNFKFTSNSMDHIAEQLGLSKKIKTDFALWRGCMEGDKASLKQMVEYNQQDVVVLYNIFDEMLPWLNMPSINGFMKEKLCCVTCGSESFVKLEGQFFYTRFGKYQLYRCLDCGKVFRDNVNLNRGKVPFIYCTH